MKKTVTFDFPDDFMFPKKFYEYSCRGCPLYASDGKGDAMCFLTGDGDYPLKPSTIKCPFYSGENIVECK